MDSKQMIANVDKQDRQKNDRLKANFLSGFSSQIIDLYLFFSTLVGVLNFHTPEWYDTI